MKMAYLRVCVKVDAFQRRVVEAVEPTPTEVIPTPSLDQDTPSQNKSSDEEFQEVRARNGKKQCSPTKSPQLNKSPAPSSNRIMQCQRNEAPENANSNRFGALMKLAVGGDLQPLEVSEDASQQYTNMNSVDDEEVVPSFLPEERNAYGAITISRPATRLSLKAKEKGNDL
ncbi:hypothetical protein AKJ16_DCAP16144 [Drosera capensis]